MDFLISIFVLFNHQIISLRGLKMKNIRKLIDKTFGTSASKKKLFKFVVDDKKEDEVFAGKRK